MNKKDTMFNEFIKHQPLDIRNWIVKVDKLLIDNDCKASVDNKGNFTYKSKENDKIVCRITLGETYCTIRPNTNNANNSDNMTNSFPDNMLEIMRNTRGCGGCAAKNPNFTQCKHGGPYKFKHGNEEFEGCRFVGFNFALNETRNYDVLEEWLRTELSA